MPCGPEALGTGRNVPQPQRISADAALRRHLEAEEHLIKKVSIAWQPMTKPYLE